MCSCVLTSSKTALVPVMGWCQINKKPVPDSMVSQFYIHCMESISLKEFPLFAGCLLPRRAQGMLSVKYTYGVNKPQGVSLVCWLPTP